MGGLAFASFDLGCSGGGLELAVCGGDPYRSALGNGGAPCALADLPSTFLAYSHPIVLMGIAVGLSAGIFEELGWTGFAIPRMKLRYGVFSTGLFVGVLWGAWRFLQGYWASGVTSGDISLALWLSTWLIGTLVGSPVVFRVLMVWVYEHTNGSLLVAMFMHTSLSASQIILIPLVWSGVASIMIGFAYAAALWVVVGVRCPWPTTGISPDSRSSGDERLENGVAHHPESRKAEVRLRRTSAFRFEEGL